MSSPKEAPIQILNPFLKVDDSLQLFRLFYHSGTSFIKLRTSKR